MSTATTTEDLLYKSSSTKRYDIPIGHLDFGYIKSCSDVKELEKILRELRSGEEGCYPDLEKCCEDKLNQLNPSSRVLRKDNPVSKAGDLPREDWQEIDKDLKSWTSDIKDVEENLKSMPAEVNGDDGLPPIRSGNIEINGPGNLETERSEPNPKRVKPRDYKEWEKVDIDKELEKVDQDEDKKTATKKTTAVSNSGSKLDDAIDPTGLSDNEKFLKATREKDKGNEAFTSKDFDEAILYYSRSLSLLPTAASYNNRALAYLKVSKWSNAVEDCAQVLKLEPQNIKALLRRGSAYKGQKEFKKGEQDFEKVLEMEPANRRAKELLTELKKDVKKEEEEKRERKEKGRRMVIEEVDECEEEENVQTKTEKECLNFNKDSVRTSASNSPEKVERRDTGKEAPNENDRHVNGVTESTANEMEEDNSKDIWDIGEVAVSPDFLKGTVDGHDGSCDTVHAQKQTSNSGSSDSSESEIMQNRTNEGTAENLKKVESAENSEISDNVKASKGRESPVEMSKSVEMKAETDSAIDSDFVNVEVTDSSKLANKSEQSSESSSSESESEQEQPIAETPGSEPIKRPVLVQLPLPAATAKLREEGNDLFRAGQYGEAMTKYTKAILNLESEQADHCVNLSLLYSNRAACNLKTGHCPDAIKDSTKSLELVPHSIKPLIRRASGYETIENFKLAYIDYKHALSLDHSVLQANHGAHRCQSMMHQLHGHGWRHNLPPLVRVTPWEVPEIVDVDGKSTAPPPSASTTETAPSNTPAPTNTPAPSNIPAPSNTSAPSNTPTPSNQATPSKEVPPSKQTAAPSSVPQPESSAAKKEESVKQSSKPLSPEEKFEASKAEGNEYVKKGDFRSAVLCYSRCMEIFPSRAVSYTNRALCHLRLNQAMDAVNYCNMALELEKGNVKALFRRGQARKMMKRYKESLEDLTQLLKLDPKNTAAKRELDLVKNYWREELNSMKSKMPSKSAKGSPTKQQPPVPPKVEQKQRKRLVIEEEDDEEAEPRLSQKGKTPKPKESVPSKPNQTNSSTKPSDGHKHVPNKKTKPTTKQASSPPPVPKLDKLTPYEFLQAWNSLKTAKDVKPYADLLRQIPPEELPTMITSKLDGQMLNTITMCVADHFIKNGEFDPSYHILNNLCKVPRFQTVSMFMGDKDKKGVGLVLKTLSENTSSSYSSEDLKRLKEAYGIK